MKKQLFLLLALFLTSNLVMAQRVRNAAEDSRERREDSRERAEKRRNKKWR